MKVLIIGYGNLGKIYAEALLAQKSIEAQELFILCKTTEQEKQVVRNGHGTPVFAHGPVSFQPDLVMLVVKPQDAGSIYATAKKHLHENTLVLSVMAGISIQALSEKLGHTKIIRAMPNSPIAIGMGMTGYATAAGLSVQEIQKAKIILATTGLTYYFEEESLLNAVTALSGSGPAYFFYVLQSMIAAGRQMGFTEEVSTLLVKQTMLGSFHLYDQSGKSISTLISEVASKGGTTEAAFKIFEEGKLDQVIIEGLKSACARAVELNQQMAHADRPLSS